MVYRTFLFFCNSFFYKSSCQRSRSTKKVGFPDAYVTRRSYTAVITEYLGAVNLNKNIRHGFCTKRDCWCHNRC